MNWAREIEDIIDEHSDRSRRLLGELQELDDETARLSMQYVPPEPVAAAANEPPPPEAEPRVSAEEAARQRRDQLAREAAQRVAQRETRPGWVDPTDWDPEEEEYPLPKTWLT